MKVIRHGTLSYLKILARNIYSSPKKTHVQYQSGFNAGYIAGKQALAEEILSKVEELDHD